VPNDDNDDDDDDDDDDDFSGGCDKNVKLKDVGLNMEGKLVLRDEDLGFIFHYSALGVDSSFVYSDTYCRLKEMFIMSLFLPFLVIL
jgi:hypothetical protein